MRRRFVIPASLAAFAFTMGVAAGAPQPRTNQTCDQPPDFYAGSVPPYRIATVRIESPFDYLRAVRNEMQDALASTKIHVGDPFTVNAAVRGHDAIRQHLNSIAANLGLPITLNVVIAEIGNCQAGSAPTLDLVFKAFVSWFPFVLSQPFESATDSTHPPGVPSQSFRIIPQAIYNRTSRLAGGMRMSVPTPLGAFALNGLASTSSRSLEVSQSGSANWDQHWIRSAESRSGLQYTDAPTVAGRNQQALLITQFSATTIPLGSTNTIFRFGASIGGGHDQAAGLGANSPQGELKTFAGVTLHAGPHSFEGSYGMKLGETTRGAQVDFAKHLADAAYTVRVLPAPYRPIDLETRFTAGWIQNLGAIPRVERFFGGNHEENFLSGGAWQIRSAPFIRSIPQNQLGPADRFAAANLTLAVTAFSRPMLPADLRSSTDFRNIVQSELKSAETIMRSYWISRDPAVTEALRQAPVAIAAIRELRPRFNAVAATVPDNLSDRFSDCDLQVSIAGSYADDLEKNTTQAKRFIPLNALAGTEEGSIEGLTACLTDLRVVLTPTFSDALIQRLEPIQKAVRDSLARVDRPAAEAKASRDMAFVRATVHTLTDEMNIIAVSPVLIFDAARMNGTHYAIGGGVRFTLLDTIRLTGGYAFNPNPRPWESRGAAFFAFDVLSLFR